MKQQFLIVELAGPAGSGKSTLTHALCEGDGKFQIGVFPDIRNPWDFPFFFWNIIMLLPVFFVFRSYKNDGTLMRQHMAMMAILNGWHRRLRRSISNEKKVVILDQGPVFMFYHLLRFGPNNMRLLIPHWFDQTCQNWADILNMVVRLDAPDTILMNRVRIREKSHGYKNYTDERVMQSLSRFRIAQDEVIHCMTASSGGPKVVYFDTSQISLNDIREKCGECFKIAFSKCSISKKI